LDKSAYPMTLTAPERFANEMILKPDKHSMNKHEEQRARSKQSLQNKVAVLADHHDARRTGQVRLAD
jgi:hypothetical protein